MTSHSQLCAIPDVPRAVRLCSSSMIRLGREGWQSVVTGRCRGFGIWPHHRKPEIFFRLNQKIIKPTYWKHLHWWGIRTVSGERRKTVEKIRTNNTNNDDDEKSC